MLQVTLTLTFDLLTLKSIGIIYWPWSSMIPRKVYLSEISLKLMSGQDFANARQTDGSCVPFLWTEVHSGIYNNTFVDTHFMLEVG